MFLTVFLQLDYDWSLRRFVEGLQYSLSYRSEIWYGHSLRLHSVSRPSIYKAIRIESSSLD